VPGDSYYDGLLAAFEASSTETQKINYKSIVFRKNMLALNKNS
jgi:hypothetical protein